MKPHRKSNSSFGTPEDLIDLQTPPAPSKKSLKPQAFTLSPRAPGESSSRAGWEIEMDGLTEHGLHTRCIKMLDRAAQLKSNTREVTSEKKSKP